MYKQVNPIEKMADDFAMRLLIPEDRLKNAINEGVKNVGELAERFGVPSTRMKQRLIDLGYKFKN